VVVEEAEILNVTREFEKEARGRRLADLTLGEPETLAAYRDFLKDGMARCRAIHREGAGGLEVTALRTALMDTLIATLFTATERAWRSQQGSSWTPVCLLALGGYGRSELCPLSDVDIMFVYPEKSKSHDFEAQRRFFSDKILYPLWDLNLKVGHSTRNTREAIQEARVEVQSKNAMLECRHVVGDRKLSKQFQEKYERFIRKENLAEYVEERLIDQRKRREKAGGTVFVQEPDIKNGVGGLRDYQNILWMVRLNISRGDPIRLLNGELLQKDEYAEFVEAYDFLLRVRNELHFQVTRATDKLDLERQPLVALELGYREEDIFLRVERFMRDYYRAARTILRYSNYLEQRLALDAVNTISFAAVLQSRRYTKRMVSDGFIIEDGRISAQSPKVFEEDPGRLIRVFRMRQQHGAKHSLELARLITHSLHLIDEKLIDDPGANRAFRSILQARGEVADTLRTMHVSGVLGAFLPEWKALECLVQHEYYHRYTADEHTLTTIRVLDGIFRRDDPTLDGKYHEALEATELPALLYLVLLLHDIGKGQSIEGHAEIGARLAIPILERLGVAPSVREKIVFLIEGHLEMARFWQHFDLDDPRTIEKFARWVRDGETLRYLYVLTSCDARGTSEDLWNSYKDSLHTQLFQATCTYFGEQEREDGMSPMISKEAILDLLPGVSADEVEAHYSLLPERYFIYHDAREIALHLRMVNTLLRTIAEADSLGSLVPVVEWEEDVNMGLTVVHIVTWDRAGLFFKLAGAFAVAGMSIVSSKALTRADHITIDTFYVVDEAGGAVRDGKAKKLFHEALENTLLHGRDLMDEIRTQAAKRRKPSYLQTGERLRAPLPPGVDVYHELSLRRTIIEVQATDAIGLLYRIGRAIYDHGFDITFARISTERNVAVDTFYIEPINRARESDTENLLALRESLTEIVEEVSEAERH
jgi:[protein-PII] uridylyltransferase